MVEVITKQTVTPPDLGAARMLRRLTQEQLAIECGMSICIVKEAEERGWVAYSHVHTLRRSHELAGIEFISPGVVKLDGFPAPTRKAIGYITGRRLQCARNALGYSRWEIASMARIGDGTLARMECRGRLKTTLPVYAVVGVLQRQGYSFAPRSRDRSLVPKRRRKFAAGDRDLRIEWIMTGRKAGRVDLDDDG